MATINDQVTKNIDIVFYKIYESVIYNGSFAFYDSSKNMYLKESVLKQKRKKPNAFLKIINSTLWPESTETNFYQRAILRNIESI